MHVWDQPCKKMSRILVQKEAWLRLFKPSLVLNHINIRQASVFVCVCPELCTSHTQGLCTLANETYLFSSLQPIQKLIEKAFLTPLCVQETHTHVCKNRTNIVSWEQFIWQQQFELNVFLSNKHRIYINADFRDRLLFMAGGHSVFFYFNPFLPLKKGSLSMPCQKKECLL